MTIQKSQNNADENGVVGEALVSPQNLARVMKPAKSGKSGTKSKQDQLIALLSKPNGARVSVIVERLGWQAHTVRAAISGLRKRGHEVVTSRSPKTGELIYAINPRPAEDGTAPAGPSS